MIPSNLYQIRIKGHLDKRWVRWLDGLTVFQQPNGETIISGTMIDQAALFGVLNRIRDLGLELISVHQQVPEDETGS